MTTADYPEAPGPRAIPETDFIDTAPGRPFTLAGTESGFSQLHGISVAPLGEENDRLVALGHLTDRVALAATSGYHRRVLGERIMPTSELTDMIRFGTQRTHVQAVKAKPDDDYAWYLDDADPSNTTAQAVTLISIEWLEREDLAAPSACPSCTWLSRSVRFTTSPDHTEWAFYHRCRYCAHMWLPTAPAPHHTQPALSQPSTPELEMPSCTRSA
ncbi:hypothetical protein [Streptomyces sp. NPDC048473]|uniref:hypothetical protein n=1 Tax=Streptomyces sp. NPDC048473 TaxID=3365556 RepID=UPI00371FE05E